MKQRRMDGVEGDDGITMDPEQCMSWGYPTLAWKKQEEGSTSIKQAMQTEGPTGWQTSSASIESQ